MLISNTPTRLRAIVPQKKVLAHYYYIYPSHPYLLPQACPCFSLSTGWLLTPFLQKIGFEAAQKLRQRVIDELHTTFASRYTRTVSLRQALSLEAIAEYSRQATGTKYLIDPSLDA